jgi:hypothetical protein
MASIAAKTKPLKQNCCTIVVTPAMEHLGRLLPLLLVALAPEASAFRIGAHLARPAVLRAARAPAPTANLFDDIGAASHAGSARSCRTAPHAWRFPA